MNDAQHYAVAIIGCGPVGKLLALQMATAGHRVAIVDRKVGTYPLPRAVTHDAEIARILQSVALAPNDIPDITQPYDGVYRWQNANHQLLLEVDWAGFGESGWYNTYFFHQPALEDRLLTQLRTMSNVVILEGWEYCEHEGRHDHVLARLRRGPDSMELSARYLVGADGAGSKVRAAMGAGWNDRQYFSDWLVVDVVPGPQAHVPDIALQTCDPQRPFTMVPGGPRRRRWEFMKLPDERIEDIDRPEFAWKLLAEHGVTPENSILERHSTYRFQAAWADQWRRDRVFLVGDAAHLMPPFAGQGLCTGFRDAMNLSWKLRAVLAGHADDSVLDTYETERIEHASATVEFSVRLGKLICVTDPAAAAERDRTMLAERAEQQRPVRPPRPRLGPGLHRGDHGGTLSIQSAVADWDRRKRLDQVLGGPGVLLVRDDRLLCQLTTDDLEHLTALGIRPCVLDADHVDYLGPPPAIARVSDIDSRYTAWLDELGCAAVLIRPDFYIYDTAEDAAALAETVHQLRSTLLRAPAQI